MTTDVKHIANQPSWDCGGCGEPWPCAAKRAELLAELAEDPAAWVGVHNFLRQQLALAVMERCDRSVEDLAEQVVGWLRRPTPDAP
jgi:hypothetical protein